MPGLGGFGSAPVRPPAQMALGGRATVDMGTQALPGTAQYSAMYGQWQKTPEGQATINQQAVDQAKIANALNPYSTGYNAAASKAMTAASGGDPYDGRFREAMSLATNPNAIRPGIPGGAPGPTGVGSPGTVNDVAPGPAMGASVYTNAMAPRTGGGGPTYGGPPVQAGGGPRGGASIPGGAPGPTGVNAWQAARSLRQRKPPVVGTGPAKPPRPYAIA